MRLVRVAIGALLFEDSANILRYGASFKKLPAWLSTSLIAPWMHQGKSGTCNEDRGSDKH